MAKDNNMKTTSYVIQTTDPRNLLNNSFLNFNIFAYTAFYNFLGVKLENDVSKRNDIFL